MDESPISNPFDEDEKRGRQPVIWVALGLIVVCCGIITVAGAVFWFTSDTQALAGRYFPSPTATFTSAPTSTPTLTPTPTNTPTPTPNSTATAIAVQATDTALAYQATAESAAENWKVILTDTFDSNKNDWPVESSDDDYAFTTYEIADGKYRWDATAHQPFISWASANKDEFIDFYLSVDIQQMEGPDSADYGIVFREDNDSNFYYFGINDQGEYVLYMYYKERDTLLNWTETDLIQQGKANRVTVIGEGSHFTFFINDHYLTEITDDTIPSGSTALAIEMTEENDHGIFEFDNYELRKP
jgi:hypothetical protein